MFGEYFGQPILTSPWTGSRAKATHALFINFDNATSTFVGAGIVPKTSGISAVWYARRSERVEMSGKTPGKIQYLRGHKG